MFVPDLDPDLGALAVEELYPLADVVPLLLPPSRTPPLLFLPPGAAPKAGCLELPSSLLALEELLPCPPEDPLDCAALPAPEPLNPRLPAPSLGPCLAAPLVPLGTAISGLLLEPNTTKSSLSSAEVHETPEGGQLSRGR